MHSNVGQTENTEQCTAVEDFSNNQVSCHLGGTLSADSTCSILTISHVWKGALDQPIQAQNKLILQGIMKGTRLIRLNQRIQIGFLKLLSWLRDAIVAPFQVAMVNFV
ncbi:hypothetical protein K1719_035612 [Acacia pycnantha]|nr:hypothetical protein K1719_035612 [Acacia pycnantha]